jgi:hypothetical protein
MNGVCAAHFNSMTDFKWRHFIMDLSLLRALQAGAGAVPRSPCACPMREPSKTRVRHAHARASDGPHSRFGWLHLHVQFQPHHHHNPDGLAPWAVHYLHGAKYIFLIETAFACKILIMCLSQRGGHVRRRLNSSSFGHEVSLSAFEH